MFDVSETPLKESIKIIYIDYDNKKTYIIPDFRITDENYKSLLRTDDFIARVEDLCGMHFPMFVQKKDGTKLSFRNIKINYNCIISSMRALSEPGKYKITSLDDREIKHITDNLNKIVDFN